MSNNAYDVFEIPSFGNGTKNAYEGHYLVIAHNTDFDYWVVSDFQYKIYDDKTKEAGKIVDSGRFTPWGIFIVATNGNSFTVRKRTVGQMINYGRKTFNQPFDAIGARKEAYGTSEAAIVAKLQKFKSDPKTIKGGKPVKIYKKPKQ